MIRSFVFPLVQSDSVVNEKGNGRVCVFSEYNHFGSFCTMFGLFRCPGICTSTLLGSSSSEAHRVMLASQAESTLDEDGRGKDPHMCPDCIQIAPNTSTTRPRPSKMKARLQPSIKCFHCSWFWMPHSFVLSSLSHQPQVRHEVKRASRKTVKTIGRRLTAAACRRRWDNA